MSSYQAYPEYRDSGVDSLGDIPSDWNVCRLKHMASIRNGADYKHVETDEGYPVIGSGGRFTFASEFMYNKPSVLLGRKGTIDKPLYVDEPFWSVDTMYYTEIFEDIPPKFLYYCALTIEFSKYTTNTALPSMTQESLGNYFFSLPRKDLDRSQIANFLDHETAKIDSLIQKQQRLIKLLKEKRQAVISHAVTKGLNPDAPMKDSGVEWLGEVPDGWDLSQAKYSAKDGTQITYGIVQAGPHIESGVPYIKTGDMSEDELPESGYSRTSKEIDEAYSRSRVEAGDLVVAIRATLGKCLLVPEKLAGANLTQGTAKISPGATIDSKFLLYYFTGSAVQQFIDSVAKGSTFREITLDMLRRVPVLIPSLSEQNKIIKYLESMNISYQKLIELASNQIELLQERRTVLISAAVTGKIDVRNWQPPKSTTTSSMDA